MNQFNKREATSQDEGAMITFNVGGELFTTYTSTILESDSTVLYNLVNSRIGQNRQQDPIFIDRNGELFRDIIFYLRTGQIYTKDMTKLVALNKEATYYEFNNMTDALEESMHEARTQQEKRQKKPKVVLKDVKEMWKTLRDTKEAHPTTYKIIEETNGKETTYSVIDIVYVKDINTCFEHRTAYCACSATPKFVLIPKSSDHL